jgi:hypothetical protein
MKLVGFIAGVLFWIFDAFLDSHVFAEGDLYEEMFAPVPVELWMRFVIFCLCIGISILADLLIISQKHAHAVLQQELEQQIADRTKGLCTVHDNFFRMVSSS